MTENMFNCFENPISENEKVFYLLALQETKTPPRKRDIQILKKNEEKLYHTLKQYLKTTPFKSTKEHSLMLAIKLRINFLTNIDVVISKLYNMNTKGNNKRSIRTFAIIARYYQLNRLHGIQEHQDRKNIIDKELYLLGLHDISRESLDKYLKESEIQKQRDIIDIISNDTQAIYYYYDSLKPFTQTQNSTIT